ncbi:hypothetical protein EN866_34850 [Mesorhizobium sp. M2D.F.Ca.ET.223.01.1.1]|uniref:hypothetical protein n=1 Tax=Mesorhizobium sp. M2D.F.Ca.ET.223.01.1.1 TaxID=2563940 RepID=UPI00109304C8|nr:hypothetical protein [Mesorhizobium sp. M2D.F.Ca.ET.223.01.1.1]TGR82326.1 hypothetical protein EN866_34850 [Mesorhizobium sp. M2D.F.Ca.ET.223.01.1.1]TGT64483.1 hypothetical protein EN802_32360 [bacterium M00.F.Ca.ET.159.01.1.1]TGT79328.1 hypothetical protein EN800_31700 [bacterium M00.F.Ca.ET.157.01.1.1]
MTLVEYAGKDEDDTPFSETQTRQANRREKVYGLFQIGYDTYSIAKMVNIREDTALRMLTIERCKRKFLPSPYGVQP